jgi:hypothetical protein
MENDRDIKFDIVIGHHERSNSAFSRKFLRSAMDKFMCHGKKERRKRIIIIIRRRNGAKTISLQMLFGRLN